MTGLEEKKNMNATFFTKNVLLQLEIVIPYNVKLEKNIKSKKKRQIMIFF